MKLHFDVTLISSLLLSLAAPRLLAETGGLECGHTHFAWASPDAADGRSGDRQQTLDLGVGQEAATKGDDLRFEFRAGVPGLMMRPAGAVEQAALGSLLARALAPLADGFFVDRSGRGHGPSGAPSVLELVDHFDSTQGSELGITMHASSEVGMAVRCGSTHTLSSPVRADNVLKHHT